MSLFTNAAAIGSRSTEVLARTIALALVCATLAIVITHSFLPVMWAVFAVAIHGAGAYLPVHARRGLLPMLFAVGAGMLDASLAASVWLLGGAVGALGAVLLGAGMLTATIFSRDDAHRLARAAPTALMLAALAVIESAPSGALSAIAMFGALALFLAHLWGAARPSASPAALERATPIKPREDRLIAVVIDAEPESREAAGVVLAQLGFAIRAFASCAEALIAGGARGAALVTLAKPQAGDWAALQELARTGAPVLALTTAENRDRAMVAGACEIVEWPVAPAALAAAAARFARIQSANKRLRA